MEALPDTWHGIPNSILPNAGDDDIEPERDTKECNICNEAEPMGVQSQCFRQEKNVFLSAMEGMVLFEQHVDLFSGKVYKKMCLQINLNR